MRTARILPSNTTKSASLPTSIDRNTALLALTRWAARFIGANNELGSIEVGKLARKIAPRINPYRETAATLFVEQAIQDCHCRGAHVACGQRDAVPRVLCQRITRIGHGDFVKPDRASTRPDLVAYESSELPTYPAGKVTALVTVQVKMICRESFIDRQFDHY